jgi:cell wall-associated NlpC family hydrolase
VHALRHRPRPQPRRGRAERRRAALLPLALAALLLLAGCTLLRPPQPPAQPPGGGAAIAAQAAALVGTPYHFGGADVSGFDCSGLALYVHERVGIAIPRSALEQQRAARPVPLAQLAPGDLVFFRIHARHVDHVGIYAGDGRFIHAPRSGLQVSYATLSSGFYAHHLKSAGRFWN